MASRYWVGGAGSWDASTTTHWAATSGGAGGASVPTSADDVFLDANSGSGAVSIAATANCLSLNCTGFIGTLTGSSDLNVYGSVTLVSGMTCTYSGSVTILGTGTVTSGGKSLTSGTFTSNPGSGGTVTLGDNFKTAGNFEQQSGTLNPNGKTVILNGTGTYHQLGYYGGVPLTLYNLTINGSSGAQLAVYTNVTIAGTFTVNNTGRVSITGEPGTVRTISAGALSFVTGVDIGKITATGAASWNISATPGGAGDLGNNTGITFTASSTRYWVGGTGNWDTTTTHWAATSGGASGASSPLPQDDVVLDANSFTAASQTLSLLKEAYCRNITMSGVTNNPTISGGGHNLLVAGNFMGGTLVIKCPVSIRGGGTHSFNQNGATFGATAADINYALIVSEQNTVVNLASDLNCQYGRAGIGSGASGCVLNTNNFNVTVDSIYIYNGATVNLGTSTLTLKGNYTSDATLLDTAGSTVTVNGGTIIAQNNSVGTVAKTFSTAAMYQTSANITFAGDKITWSGAATMTGVLTLNIAGMTNGLIMGTGTKTVTSIVTNGSAGNLVKITSSSPGTARYIKQINNNPLFIDYANMTDLSAVGNAGSVSSSSSTVANTTFNMTTLTGGATTLTTLTDDDQVTGVPIGFTFNWFGTNLTTLNVGSNGLLGLNGYSATSASGEYGADISLGSWSNIIAGVWCDLLPSAGGTIKYETQGTAPNRVFIVEYNNIQDYNDATALYTFQIKLFETSNNVEIHVQNSKTSAWPFVQGIVGQSGAGWKAANSRYASNIETPDITNDGKLFTQTGSSFSWSNYCEYYARNCTDGGNNANWRFASRPGNLFMQEM